ncbi:TIGR02281 family clan AA aspartic protease [Aquabacterium sp. J223]|uniref:retropepsin-like aspartic protease family protein n=1 Tax=Aquabacterium sp. J223 TaxID=2898431 RepID=UPI0021ADD5E6|nr:TIGR02281 family clan AA aspartic protease [Aquabacterium sp. J223]UUX96294.1 TIGR02281 family clan AA aspartic protease [Aquabacterium sp. J223]
MRHGLKLLTVWLLVTTAVFLGFKTWEHRQAATRFELQGESVVLRRGADGHYHWPGRLQGRAVDFLVDTGATQSAVSTTLARSLGLPEQGTVTLQTAGGPVQGRVVLADLDLDGGLAVQRLRLIALDGLGERGAVAILGMDVLGRLRWEQSEGRLRIDLRRR